MKTRKYLLHWLSFTEVNTICKVNHVYRQKANHEAFEWFQKLELYHLWSIFIERFLNTCHINEKITFFKSKTLGILFLMIRMTDPVKPSVCDLNGATW